jgi:hypothetical protein
MAGITTNLSILILIINDHNSSIKILVGKLDYKGKPKNVLFTRNPAYRQK